MSDMDKFTTFFKKRKINYTVEIDCDGDGNDFIFIQTDKGSDITFKFHNGKYLNEIDIL